MDPKVRAHAPAGGGAHSRVVAPVLPSLSDLPPFICKVRVNILALDSDVIVRADPYPHLRGAFGNYTLITAFDTKGGFARINIGVMYVQRAAVGGPVHALLVEFMTRVDQTLAMRVPPSKRERAAVEVRLFWDQNLFNKVLLSAMAGRRLYVPDNSDEEWRRAHGGEITAAGISFKSRVPSAHSATWRQPTAHVATPSALTVRPPWYPRRSEFRWVELRSAPPGGAPPGGAPPGGAPPGGEGVAERVAERVLLAPPWLVSADNSLGERYKHWLYGARPTPYAPPLAPPRPAPPLAPPRSRRDLVASSSRSRRGVGAGA